MFHTSDASDEYICYFASAKLANFLARVKTQPDLSCLCRTALSFKTGMLSQNLCYFIAGSLGAIVNVKYLIMSKLSAIKIWLSGELFVT